MLIEWCGERTNPMKNAYTRIYIIYRFSTKDELDARLNYIKGDNKNIVYFHFSEDSDKHWKKKAKAKMRDCDFAILFYDNSAFPENEKPVNVEYELELVKQFNKKLIAIYTSSKEELKAVSEAINNKKIDKFYKNRKQELNDKAIESLFGSDFSEESFDKEAFKPMNIVEGKKRVLEYSEWSIDESLDTKLLDNNQEMHKEYYSLLMRQYELMIQTSENLIKRRSEMSDKYRTICIALMSLVSATLVFGNLFVTGLLMLLAGFVNIFLSIPWKAALEEFSKNNEGKFAVINAIEKKLPANMFDTEYTYNTFKGIRTYSVREMSFPKTFKIAGIILAIVGVILFGCAIWALIVNKTFNLYEIFKISKE